MLLCSNQPHPIPPASSPSLLQFDNIRGDGEKKEEEDGSSDGGGNN